MAELPVISANDIVSKAREFLGTPWKHTGRLKGVGIDCAGLLSVTFSELGVPITDNITYSTHQEFKTLLAELSKYALELKGMPNLPLTIDEAVVGDILVFSGPKMWNHCGIYTGDGCMIHAYSSPSIMKVVEHPISPDWPLVRIFRYKMVWQPSS